MICCKEQDRATGYLCTEPVGHVTRHIARTSRGVVIVAWDIDEPEPETGPEPGPDRWRLLWELAWQTYGLTGIRLSIQDGLGWTAYIIDIEGQQYAGTTPEEALEKVLADVSTPKHVASLNWDTAAEGWRGSCSCGWHSGLYAIKTIAIRLMEAHAEGPREPHDD